MPRAGIPSKSEVTHPAQLLSKSQGSRLVTWILRQDALSYAPSHSQVRATVAALLRQRGPGKGYHGIWWVFNVFIIKFNNQFQNLGLDSLVIGSSDPKRKAVLEGSQSRYSITSDNGSTDNHIAVEWLKEVYLPQIRPEDKSNSRLIILDDRRSHVSDQWIDTCFFNNIYYSFNASKSAYRGEL
ncbi:hypothetical protein HZ326_28250 [Fusarium oxysporum f. sp. albedinis]|nr:hypothetical protein HZ326_28250 [Fusarium oxysporum f. sp. albedinis]